MYCRWKHYKKTCYCWFTIIYISSLVHRLCYNTLKLPHSSVLTLQRQICCKTNAADWVVLKMNRFYHAVLPTQAHRNAWSTLCKNGEIPVLQDILFYRSTSKNILLIHTTAGRLTQFFSNERTNQILGICGNRNWRRDSSGPFLYLRLLRETELFYPFRITGMMIAKRKTSWGFNVQHPNLWLQLGVCCSAERF